MLVEYRTDSTANSDQSTRHEDKNRPFRNTLLRGLLGIGLFGCIAQVDLGTTHASDVAITTYTQCGGEKHSGARYPKTHTIFVRKIVHDNKVTFETFDLQPQGGQCGNINHFVPFDKSIDPEKAKFLGMKLNPDNGTVGQYWQRADGAKGFVFNAPNPDLP